MAADSRPPLLALGYANTDVIARVQRLPGDGDRVTASEILTYPGGMAANCACAGALLGGRASFLGNVGRDVFGDGLLEDFRRYGVDTSYVTRPERTTVAIVTVTTKGERTIISEPTEYQPGLARACLLAQQFGQGFLYVDGYHLGWAREEIRLARAKGLTIYCDLDGAPDTYPREQVLELLSEVDIAQWNPKVAAALFPGEETERADHLLAERVKTLISTRGAEDLRLLDDGKWQRIPVPSAVNATDTTGAGDILAGAFLHFHAAGVPAGKAVLRAVEIASDSTRHLGARLPLKWNAHAESRGKST
jgi:sugar/nucleoside kinase (ribokinase family)